MLRRWNPVPYLNSATLDTTHGDELANVKSIAYSVVNRGALQQECFHGLNADRCRWILMEAHSKVLIRRPRIRIRPFCLSSVGFVQPLLRGLVLLRFHCDVIVDVARVESQVSSLLGLQVAVNLPLLDNSIHI